MARSPNEHTTLEARAGTWRGPSTLRTDDRSSPRFNNPDPPESSARSAERLASASCGMPDLAAAGYRLHGTIGKGGLGVVYEALCMRTQQRVAIKVARPGVLGAVDALRREIRVLENLRHPGIVRFIDKGEVDAAAFFVMELVTGPSLADHLAARPQTGADATLLSALRRICSTLAFIHGEGLVHRDLSPRNILFKALDAPVIVDFGLTSHFAGRTGRETLEGGSAAGTRQYMAPEQLRGELVDPRADLYSFGCILYQALTGQPPLAARDRDATKPLRPHQSTCVPADLAGVDPTLGALVIRLLKDHPAQRIGYAEEVCAILESFGAQDWPSSPRSPVRHYVYRAEFVGRADIFSEIVAHAKGCLVQRGGGVFFVGGESGSGKTRLLSEIATQLIQLGLCVVTGSASAPNVGNEVGCHATGDPALNSLRPLFLEISNRCNADAHCVERVLGPRASLLSQYASELRGLFGVNEQPQPQQLSSEAANARLINYVQETIAALGAEQPLALILDDFHWSDSITRELICRFPEGILDKTPLLIIASYRSEEADAGFRSSIGLAECARHHLLPRLSQPETNTIIQGMLAVHDVPAALTSFIHRQTAGNPFFVGEYVRELVEDSTWVRRSSRATWEFPDVASEFSNSHPLPGSAREVVLSRLNRLSESVRSTLDLASIFGTSFRLSTLLIASESCDARSTMQALQELAARQIVAPIDDDAMQFMHDKIREATLSAIPRARRRQLHELAVKALEALATQATPNAASCATLAHHCAEAGAVDKALAYWERAGEASFSGADYRSAISAFTAAIAATVQLRGLPVRDATLARWEYKLGESYYCSGDIERSELHLKRSLAAHGVAWPVSRPQLRLLLAKNLATQARHLLLSPSQQRHALPEQTRSEVALAASRLGFIGIWKRDSISTLLSMLLAANVADTLDSPPSARAYTNLAFVAGMARLKPLERRYLGRARTSKATESERGHSYYVEAYLRAGEGKWGPAEQLGRKALEVCAATDDLHERGTALAVLGFIARSKGHFDEGLHYAWKIRTAARSYGNTEQQTWSEVLAASCLLRLGRPREASAHLKRGSALLRKVPEWVCELRVNAQLAHAALDEVGPSAEVDALTDTGMRTMDEINGPPFIVSSLDGVMSLAHVSLELWYEAARGNHDQGASAATVDRALRAVRYCRKLSTVFPIARPYYQICLARAQAQNGHVRKALRTLHAARDAAAALELPFERALADWHSARWTTDPAEATALKVRAQQLLVDLGRQSTNSLSSPG
jgi:tetratricopeptide (TPR) repeat protein